MPLDNTQGSKLAVAVSTARRLLTFGDTLARLATDIRLALLVRIVIKARWLQSDLLYIVCFSRYGVDRCYDVAVLLRVTTGFTQHSFSKYRPVILLQLHDA